MSWNVLQSFLCDALGDAWQSSIGDVQFVVVHAKHNQKTTWNTFGQFVARVDQQLLGILQNPQEIHNRGEEGRNLGIPETS